MLRIIVETCDAGMAVNAGGSVLTTHKTFDVELPEIERLLLTTHTYSHNQVIGVEIIPERTQTGSAE